MDWRNNERGKRPPRIRGLSRKNPQKSRDTALSGANPCQDTENCVLSCHAWLLRKLGYNTVAPPGPYDPPGVAGSTAVHSTKFWHTQAGHPPAWSNRKGSTPATIRVQLNQTPVGHYGLLRYSGFPSHVMGWEHRKDGIVLVDPQSGTETQAGFLFGDHGSFQWVDMTDCKPTAGIASLFEEV